MAFEDGSIHLNSGFFLYNNYEAIEYHDTIMEILDCIEHATKSQIIIYGGYVRRIIEHCFESVDRDLYDRPFDKPKNVNIWLLFPNPIKIVDWLAIKRQILEILIYTYGPIFTEENPEQLTDNNCFKFTICNISFEIKTQISDKHNYTINTYNCDFTANNLMMDMKGNIIVRMKCIYDLNTIISHIHDKKLYSIYEFKYSEHHPLNIKAHKFLEIRRTKMVNFGYF